MKIFITLIAAAISTASIAQVPQIVAHRGFWKTEGSAQNSITALQKADSIGCYAAELDVWLTADDVLVVNHNADICDRVVETSTWPELVDCRLSNGEPLPTLEAYLMAARPLNIDLVVEIKPHHDRARELPAVEKTIAMIEEKGLTDRVSYITFSRNAFDLLVAKSGRSVAFLSAMDPDELKAAGGAGADYQISVYRQNPDWIPRLKELGLTVNIWTIRNDEDLQWCIDNGADYITTDIPAQAVEAVNAQGSFNIQ